MNRGAHVLLTLLVTAGGCAAHSAPPAAPSASVEPVAYRIQIGDQLDLQFYKTPELNTRVRVRPDGKIAVQLIDEVVAAGLTPAELDAQLTTAYSGELRAPQVTVSLVAHGARRVYVGGEVGQPTMLHLDGELTAFQAIQQAGGFAETAAPDSVVLIRRDAAGKSVGSTIDLRSVGSGRYPEHDPALQAQDIVFVPRSRIADVNRFVDQYIRKNLPMSPSFGMGLGAF